MQWCHNMMMPLGAKYKTYSSREFLLISFINSGRFSFFSTESLKASVYFTLLSASHVALCCRIKERRREGGTHKLTPDWAGGTNMLKKISSGPKMCVWKWHCRNPIFPFLTGPKEGLGGTDETVHAIFRVRDGGQGCVDWVRGHSSPLSLFT